MSVIAYIDESGDDGLVNNYSSPIFILTTTYMKDIDWDKNNEIIRNFRLYLRDSYGIPVSEEFHAAKFFTDKNPYRKYNFDIDQKKSIVDAYCKVIASMNLRVINVIIDKEKVVRKADYPVLKNALTYTIQRIENDSDWKYIIVADKGRVSIMKKTARQLKKENPISSMFSFGTYDVPIKNMVEDILEKDSAESYFIQVSDFISFVVNLYYKYCVKKKPVPKRILSWITLEEIIAMMNILKNVYNINASYRDEYGLVIYPKS